jgi:hypothetical protein
MVALLAVVPTVLLAVLLNAQELTERARLDASIASGLRERVQEVADEHATPTPTPRYRSDAKSKAARAWSKAAGGETPAQRQARLVAAARQRQAAAQAAPARRPSAQQTPTPPARETAPQVPAPSAAADSDASAIVVAVVLGGTCALAIDGTSRGVGKSFSANVAPGPHTVTCAAKGRAPQSRSVRVQAGQKAVASFQL